MTLPVADAALHEALGAFPFGGRVAQAQLYGKGHINETYLVDIILPNGQTRPFILQRINTHVFPDVVSLMGNIVGVTRHLQQSISQTGGNPQREALTVIPAQNGSPFYTTADGGAWRCYYFIQNTVCYQVAPNASVLYQAARAFARFSLLLQDYPAETLRETIPHFHDTPKRLADLQAAVAANPMGRAQNCQTEIEFALQRQSDCFVLANHLSAGRLSLCVTHNDTKLNNVLLDETSGECVCIIDLDTVMPGLLLHDYGDSIRSGAHSASEDERDLGHVSFSLPYFEAYTKGYLEVLAPYLSPLEKELLPWGAKLMTLECGMRFLTDYLLGDTYFKIARPDHNLVRTRTQFKLVHDMEENWQKMQQTIARYTQP